MVLCTAFPHMCKGMTHPLFEIRRELLHVSFRVRSEKKHLALVRLRGQVALKTVGITALFLTHLTPELQFLKALGLHSIGDGFEREGKTLTEGVSEEQRPSSAQKRTNL